MTCAADDLLFINGPVQNGKFSFIDRPGKAVGIRIAAALSAILDTQLPPHLWNTVTLAGDLRYRAYVSSQGGPLDRAEFEAKMITAKYLPDLEPRPQIMTDTNERVAVLALEMIENGLSSGVLKVRKLTVRMCARCAHMTGTGNHSCQACGHAETRRHQGRYLTADRDAALHIGREQRHILWISR